MQWVLKASRYSAFIARDLGRNLVPVTVKEDQQNQTLQIGLEWGHSVRQALQNGDVELHYQPIWDFKQEQVAYFEALLRLKINDS